MKSDFLKKDSYILKCDISEQDVQEFMFNYRLKPQVVKNKNGEKEVDLSMKEIRKLHKNTLIRIDSNIKILRLNSNYLTTLPYQITTFINLSELHLCNNNMKFIPVQIFSLKRLQVLNLSCNRISSVPVTLPNMKQLKKIDFSYNEIQRFVVQCEALENVEELNLEGNFLKEFPKTKELKELRILNLGKNDIKYLSKELLDLKNLEELHIAENGLFAISFCLRDFLQRLKVFKVENSSTVKNKKNNQKNNFVLKHNRVTSNSRMLDDCCVFKSHAFQPLNGNGLFKRQRKISI